MAPPSGQAIDETWDDSEPLAFWDQAIEEYKKYHSLAARGERVQPQACESSTRPETQAADSSANTCRPTVDEIRRHNMQRQQLEQGDNERPNGSTAQDCLHSAQPGVEGIGLPQQLLGTQSNGEMKNLLMAWYYAGYYTGLYEGQQKAWNEMQQKP